jgi:steroid delta-isomerase-like uncharacterized protein
MTAAANKALVRCLMTEVLGQGRLELISLVVAADYVGHLPIGDHYGPKGVRIDIAAYRAAVPDLAVSLDDLLADGDRVVRRFTLRGTHRGAFLGVPASGQEVVVRGIAIDRIARDQLVESWVHIDDLAIAAWVAK